MGGVLKDSISTRYPRTLDPDQSFSSNGFVRRASAIAQAAYQGMYKNPEKLKTCNSNPVDPRKAARSRATRG